MKILEQIWSTWRKAVMTFVLVGSSIASVLAQNSNNYSAELIEAAKKLDSNDEKGVWVSLGIDIYHTAAIIDYFKENETEKVFIDTGEEDISGIYPTDDSVLNLLKSCLLNLYSGLLNSWEVSSFETIITYED